MPMWVVMQWGGVRADISLKRGSRLVWIPMPWMMKRKMTRTQGPSRLTTMVSLQARIGAGLELIIDDAVEQEEDDDEEEDDDDDDE